MTDAEKKALEADGWWTGDAADFLGMDEEERQELELRLGLARAIRERRKERNLTQKQLAARLGTSQPRVAKIEMADWGVSLDQMLKALRALGGRAIFKVVEAESTGRRKPRSKKCRTQRV
jgi:ribosome-binding protein aMBF1 (putative translation factor)